MNAGSTRSPGARVAVTGLGLVTSLGLGLGDNWRRLCAGESGVRALRRFDASGLRTRIAATVDAFGECPELSNAELCYRCAYEAVQEAVAQAGLWRGQRRGLPLYYGTSAYSGDWQRRIALHAQAGAQGPFWDLASLRGGRPDLVGAIARDNDNAQGGRRLADEFGLDGPVVTLTTACATGASAIALAVQGIRRGRYERALVCAADAAVSAENIARFSLLSALSAANEPASRASRPFDRARDGFVMGEGAAALVLESEAAARARGADILGFILGVGSATDNFHKTRSHPSGEFIVRSMRSALDDAGLDAAAIDSINAHGTSTQENDKMEALGIGLLFGAGANRIPVTANKSMIGHTLCGAGAVEAVIGLQSIIAQTVPPTINLEQQDPAIALDVVKDRARAMPLRTVLSNSFGFGGQNVSLVLGH
jgi:3-oxoacyl-[acyl-carrier-protein] synthase II